MAKDQNNSSDRGRTGATDPEPEWNDFELDQGSEDAVDQDILPADEGESPFEIVLENVDPDKFKESLSHFTDDDEIMDDFVDRQLLNTGGGALEEKLQDYTMNSPEISGGDIDAAWEDAEVAGEETLGGSSPTPDQDTVDELGQAAGITYGIEEPLNSDKINDRDRDRWELNPESADDTDFRANQNEYTVYNEDEEELVDDDDG